MKKLLLFSLLMVIGSLLIAETITVNSSEFNVEVVSTSEDQTVLEFNIGSFEREAVTINGDTFYKLSLAKEANTFEKGEPSLPKISRSIIIPDNASMETRIVSSEYVDYRMPVAPSKGILFRDVNPEDVPYDFSSVYNQSEMYPSELSNLSDPYILRDYRGVVVNVYPFAYNPQTQLLRVYTNIVVEVVNTGFSNLNAKNRNDDKINANFTEIYTNHFINFDVLRYTPVEEQGRMIVICYGDFIDAMMPFVNWKNQKGIKTEIYDVADIGSNGSSIDNFIQTEYDLNDGLAFVQLVGDGSQLPSYSAGSTGYDPKYGLKDGTDHYPDIFIGRFSAETVEQVETQVARSITYERDIIDGEWLHKGMGVASNQGTGDDGEDDDEHMDNIRDDLLGYNYTEVDQIYDFSGTAADVTTALNNGRSVANYCGHGSETTWVSTGFSNSHINSLQNDNMLPFINSVACVNGNFVNNTCFAEAWLRATNNTTGEPTGAIAIYASSINQSWDPPMRAQDETADLLVGELKNTVGGLLYNGSCNMIDVYGNGGNDMYDTWHIFGDASLQVRTDTPEAMVISHNPTLFIGQTFFDVSTGVEDAQVCLSYNNEIIGAGYTDESGSITLDLTDAPAVPADLILTITAYNKITSVETISLVPNDGPYVVINSTTVTSGDDNVIAFGETASMDITLENVGTVNAENTNITLSIDDPYITLTDSDELFGTINAESTVSLNNVVFFTIANNVPDNYAFTFDVLITAGDDSWESDLTYMAYAPVLQIDGVSVANDADGNGRLDPGETADVTVLVSNIGGASVNNLEATLSEADDFITINSSVANLGVIASQDFGSFTYNVTADETTEIGHSVNFGLDIAADNEFSLDGEFIYSVGLCFDDFETGDLTAYSWETLGDGNWAVSDDAYEGNYAVKSGTIGSNEETELCVQLDVLTDGSISFFKKVSSDSGDDLEFYIDSELQGNWSGTVDWSEETFSVTRGTHTFRWVYTKNAWGTSGSDCAYIDNVIFPSVLEVQPSMLSLNIDSINESLALNETSSHTLALSNIGGGTIDYTLRISDTSDERNISGSYLECDATDFIPGVEYTWTFTVYNMSTDSEWLTNVSLTFPEGVIVNGATDLTGGNSPLVYDNTTGDGVTMNWVDPDDGYGEIYGNESASAEVTVLVGAGFYGDITLNYEITGDEWGGDPHSVSGDINLTSLGEPLTWITLSEQSGGIFLGDTDEIEITFDTNDIEVGTYTCDLIISHDGVEDIIPITLAVGAVDNNDITFGVPVTRLVGNYPNPFNPVTTIEYDVKEAGQVSVEVYNVRGQRVKTLVNENKESGNYKVQWFGNDDSSKPVASGIYFYKMKAGRFTSTKKMILMK